MLGNVLNEVIQRPATLVFHWAILGILRRPEKCWEPGYFIGRGHIVRGGVELHDLDVLVDEFLAQLVEDGRQLLAVAAPRGIEFDQRILVVICHHLVEVSSHRDLNVASVIVRDWLRLQVRFQSARFEILEERFERIHRKLLLHRELLVLRVLRQNDRLVTLHEVDSEVVQFMLEVIFGRNSEVQAGEVLGDLDDSVAPVVRALRVLHVIYGIVGDH